MSSQASVKFIYNTLVTGQSQLIAFSFFWAEDEGFVSKERMRFSFHFVSISVLFGYH